MVQTMLFRFSNFEFLTLQSMLNSLNTRIENNTSLSDEESFVTTSSRLFVLRRTGWCFVE